MQTAICCIVKCENSYLREWVDYHFKLGFNHIYIYDNNDVDGERIEGILSDYIGKYVSIIDCRGKKAYQSVAYTEFYNLYGDKYDWIAFIDADEFITFSEASGYLHINDYLLTINDFEVIHLNWMCYGDNDIVEYNSNKVLDRFTQPLPLDKHIQYDFPENNHVKSIIKGGLDLKGVPIIPHSPPGSFRICDERGIERTENSFFKPYSFEIAYIRHYTTKTIYEWIQKIARGRATCNSIHDLYSVDRFFKYNDDTKEKRDVVNNFMFFKDVLITQSKTELDILKREYEGLFRENEKIKRDLDQIQTSKAYKLGKLLLKPLSFLK
ncbi:MAG: glycosyltransferase family 2 protein [Mangrovibacterium sp.]